MEDDFDFQASIERLRANVSKRLMRAGFFERRHVRLKAPRWIKRGDPDLLQRYEHHDALLRTGRIVWGTVVQANEHLFVPGQNDRPGALIYSLDPVVDADVDVLLEAADQLFSVKGARTTPELQVFADHLGDEYTTDIKLPVPLSISEGIQCYYTTLMFHRKHLHDGYLGLPLVPVAAHPDLTEAVTVVPARYYDRAYVRAFS